MSDSIENEDGSMFLDVDDADHFRWLRDEECPRLHKIVDAAIEWWKSGATPFRALQLASQIRREVDRRREVDIVFSEPITDHDAGDEHR